LGLKINLTQRRQGAKKKVLLVGSATHPVIFDEDELWVDIDTPFNLQLADVVMRNF
jgi:hypothetical protein